MKVTFYGGAKGVTGSKHLVEIGGYRVLLDCGQFQGHHREARKLNAGLPFDPATIDIIVLSHGHLDHCGSLPLMIRGGYKGKIFTTAATRDVAEWILKDAAHIQEQDAKYINKHRLSEGELAEPIFTIADVEEVMKRFIAVPYFRESRDWFSLAPSLHLKLYDAGHILGSAVVVLEGVENNKPVRLAFTGDLGRAGTPLIPDPEYIQDEVPYLLLESTYGDRLHRKIEVAKAQLIEEVNNAYKNNSKIIVPCFALGRTQEFIYILHKLTDEGKLPRIPIYIDSPLASKITEVFAKHQEDFDKETWEEFSSKGEVPLAFRNLNFVHTIDESKALNIKKGPFIVISASGMCEAGRILHHLINGIADPNNVVMITGFQALHTLGRHLVEGGKTVRIWGKQFKVGARVVVLNEFSAHADRDGLEQYAEHVKGLKQLFLVHGEITNSEALKNSLEARHPEWQVFIPEPEQTIALAGS